MSTPTPARSPWRPRPTPARWFELAVRTAIPLLAVALAVAAVVESPRLVGAPPERAGRQAATRHAVPVQSAVLSCPGLPDAEDGGPPTGGRRTRVQVLAASPPPSLRPVVRRGTTSPIAPEVSVLALGAVAGSSGARLSGLSEVRGALGGAGAVVALGRGWSAPGLVAEQWSVRTSGDQRGLTAATCLPATDEVWLVGGGDEEGRRGRLVLSNPHDCATQVTVDVLADEGPVPRGPGGSVLLAPRSRTEVLLDALAPGAGAPVVRVRSTGASVGAVLQDSWLDGLVPRGVDDVLPGTPPGRQVLVPGVRVPGTAAGRVLLRVAVPGTAEGVAQVRMLGPSGPVRLPGTDVVRVPAGTTRDVDLSAAPAGGYGVVVQADVPVLAAAVVEQRRGDGPGELAWATSSAAVSTLAGAGVPDGPGAAARAWRTQVLLTAVPPRAGERSDPVVDVVSVLPGGGRRTRTVTVPVGSSVPVAVTGRTVWVRPRPGHAPVVAARWTERADPAGALITVSPMRQVLLRQVPVEVAADLG